MGHTHSVSAGSSAGGGDSGGGAAVAEALVISPSPFTPPALNKSLMEPRWTARRLSAEQAADLCTELARLVVALELAYPADRPEEGGAEVARVSAAAHKGEGDAHAWSGVPLKDPLAEESAALLLKPFEEVHLSGYRLGDAALTSPIPPDLPSFLLVVSRHKRLSVLDLSFNELTPQVLVPLLQAIRDLPLLVVLKLSGNLLGSARGDDNHSDLHEKWDLATVSVDEELGGAATAAARLGHWLATNPALLELALFHCDLNDRDVRALLSGLVHPRNTTLHTLQLSWNLACTSRSAQMALQLVTDLRNTTLCKVDLEGVAPATQVRLEYACTPDGLFRSGRTLIPASAGTPTAAGDDDNSGKTATVDSSAATADVVDLEQLRQQQQQLAEIQTRLTPAQGARYENRCRYLEEDLDGSRVLAPLIMHELAAVLSTRPQPQPRIVEHYGANVLLDTATLAAREMNFASTADTGTQDGDGGTELLALVTAKECGGDNPHNGRAAPSPAASTNSPTGAHRPPPEAAPHPHTSDAIRPRTCPPTHLRRSGLTSAVSMGRVNRSSSGRHSMHQEWQRNRTPQERRDARFETPQRLAGVMADAEAFRRRLRPVPLDTHAPPCAEVSRHRSGARSASATGVRATWYADDDFVLRSNGLSKVLLAPVLPGGAAAYHNVALEDVQDRPLHPCWCTPRQTSAMTGMFAGTLHYHCVHEAAAQKKQQPQHGASSPPPTSAAETVVRPPNPNRSKSRLPLLLPQVPPPPPPQQQQQPSIQLSNPAEMYCGCQGTGHLCLSACAASEEAGGARRRDRMRVTLRAKSAKGIGKAGVSGRGASASRKSDGTRARFLDWMATDGDDNVHKLYDTVVTTTAPPSLRVHTVHTACGSLSVALNYDPVSHFSAQHVSCASDMTLAEF
nr:unnamed protein product [Leishmania braziliensis]